MREIVSPLSGFGSPFGFRRAGSGGGGAPALDYTVRTLNSDAVRTWYNHPVVPVFDGRVYAGAVQTDGSVTLTKASNVSDTVFTLNRKLEVDDHNEAASVQLPGGRIASFYSRHSNIGPGIRHRVSSSPLPDLRNFAAEVLVSDGSDVTSYALPTLLSDGVVRTFFRSGGSSTRPRKMMKAPAADVEAGTASWAISTVIETANQRPYIVIASSADRIDFAVTNGHPNEISTSLFHFYMQLVGGVEKWFTTAGVEITSLPIDVNTQATLVDNDTNGRVWVDKVEVGPDGHPRILFMKYPTGTTGANTANGGLGTTYSNIEYWHARWNGAVWVKNRISTGNRSLYPTESYYHGGLCFDGNDVTTLYLCEWVGSQYELRQYTFNETTGAMTLVRSITSASANPNFRPDSPSGANRPWAVTWINGVYTTFTNYSTAMRAAGTVTTAFTPLSLFADGEQGGWWDPSDFSTMFQDTAGTIPVTATGQTVRRINDKSGNGNHLLSTSGLLLEQDGNGYYYLSFNNHSFSCENFNFSTCSGVSVFAGIRKNADAAAGILCELSTSTAANPQTFGVFAPAGATPTFTFRSRGSGGNDAQASASGFAAPLTAVLTGTGEINGDHCVLRVNGAQVASATTPQGSGLYTNNTLFVGRRAGTSTPFNGRIYGLIIRGARSGRLSIDNAEAWLNARCGAF